jgi:hypothetical protein
VTAHPDVAVRYRLLATPAIAIDGQLAFTGVPREEALRVRLEAAAARAYDIAERLAHAKQTPRSCIGSKEAR